MDKVIRGSDVDNPMIIEQPTNLKFDEDKLDKIIDQVFNIDAGIPKKTKKKYCCCFLTKHALS